jgi:hypothetical protein
MRTFLFALSLAAWLGCAASNPPAAEWRRADGSAADLEQLKADRARCLNRAGVPSPGSRSPMQATRDDMIDCMRMRSWVPL